MVPNPEMGFGTTLRLAAHGKALGAARGDFGGDEAPNATLVMDGGECRVGVLDRGPRKPWDYAGRCSGQKAPMEMPENRAKFSMSLSKDH